MDIAKATVSFNAQPKFLINGQQKSFSEIEVGGKKFQGIDLGNGSFAKLKARPGGKFDVVLFRGDGRDISQMSVKVNGGAVSRLKTTDKQSYEGGSAKVLKDKSLRFNSEFAKEFTKDLTPVKNSPTVKSPEKQVPVRPLPLTPPQKSASDPFFNAAGIRTHPEKGARNVFDDLAGSYNERVGAHATKQKPSNTIGNGERMISIKGDRPEERLMRALDKTIPLNNLKVLYNDTPAHKVVAEQLNKLPLEKQLVDMRSMSTLAFTGGVRVLPMPMGKMAEFANKGQVDQFQGAAKEFQATAQKEIERFKFAGELLTNKDMLSQLSWSDRRQVRALGEAYLNIAKEMSDPQGVVQRTLRFTEEVAKDPEGMMRGFKIELGGSEPRVPTQEM